MLDLTGDGVLALWNGVETSRTREYNAWHTREHVPERVSVPGMIGARRYVKSSGLLAEYLTLYSLESTNVLNSDAYRSLLDNPTDWSRSMRSAFRGFLRIGCRRLLSLGGGLGNSVAALVVDEGADLHAPALWQELKNLLARPGLFAAHILERDRDIPDVPFKIGGDALDFPKAGVILLEAYDENELIQLLPAIRAGLARLDLDVAAKTLTAYRLAYALDRISLKHLVPLKPDVLPNS